MGICIARKLHEPPIILYCEKKCGKYVENNNTGKLWKNCEKNSVEKYVENNSMGKVWKIITHGNSENHHGDNVLKG
jgi:hypothetical protein